MIPVSTKWQALVSSALLILVAGCSSSEPDEAPEGAWGDATAVEELAIGIEFGADEYMFGNVSDIAVSSDGTIYVADNRPTVVRVYDEGGNHLRDIGRQGQGPGGDLGEVAFPPADRVGRGFGLFAEGVSAPTTIETISAWSPLGYVVAGRNDTYEIELRKPEGTAHLRRELEPVPLHAEEQTEWEAFRQTVIRMARKRGTDAQYDPDPIPDVKPFFRDIFVGEDGRIWVFRYVAAHKRDDVEPLPDRPDRPLLTWREPWTFDVFEPDGTFLGSVQVPELLEPHVFRGDRIWGTRIDEEGVEQVVCLRVVPGASP